MREEIDRLPAAEAAAGFIGLLNGLLGSRRAIHDPPLVRQLCLATIERCIERELDAAPPGRAFASSRTRLYDCSGNTPASSATCVRAGSPAAFATSPRRIQAAAVSWA